MSLAVIAFGLFIVLLVLGLWAPFAIAAAALGYIVMQGGLDGLRAIGFVSWGGMNSFTLTAIPLFILMSEILVGAGVAARVYSGLSRLVSRLPGGLLQTNIVGCAVFSAISGSSVATAATIGTVAMPQLLRRGYSPELSAGSLAAGGTLGILIPPSIAMIIYGTFTETSVSKLFFAGLLPGLMLAAMFMAYIAISAHLRNPVGTPHAACEDRTVPLARTLADVLPFGVVIAATLGALYAGFVTPTEAAAVGCVMSVVVGRLWGTLDWRSFRVAVREAMRTSAAMLFIVFAAFLFSYAVGIDGVGQRLAERVTAMNLSRLELLVLIVVLYLILGCLVESIGMMVITIPLLHPVLLGYGVDLIWFGVVLVLLIELGQLTPPMGINLFVIQSIWSRSFGEVTRGALPFMGVILLALGLLSWFPQIATWLPEYVAQGR